MKKVLLLAFASFFLVFSGGGGQAQSIVSSDGQGVASRDVFDYRRCTETYADFKKFTKGFVFDKHGNNAPKFLTKLNEYNSKLNQACQPKYTPLPNCEIYNVKECKNGERLITEKDQNGCPKPSCVPDKPKCTIDTLSLHQVPECRKGERIVTGKDQNGCPKPICEPEKVNDKCEIARYGNPSQMPVECLDKPKPVCAAHQVPECIKGTRLVTKKDSAGCPKPVCIPDEVKPSCPIIRPFDCGKGGRYSVRVDGNGCKIGVCMSQIENKRDY